MIPKRIEVLYMNSVKKKNLAISIVFLLFGAFVYYQSLGIKTLMSNDVGSAFFPKFIAISIIVIAVIKIILTLKDRSVIKRQESKTDLSGGWLTILLLGVYVIVFAEVGFLISTAVYLFLQILLLTPKDKRRYPLLAIISVATPIFIYTLFVYIIRMPLPKGIFGF